MDLRIVTRNAELTPAEQRRLRDLNARMTRYFRKIVTVSWTFSAAAVGFTAGCSIHSQSGYYRSRASAEKIGAAMDMAFEKVVRQRRRKRVKSVTARSRAGSTGKRALVQAKSRD